MSDHAESARTRMLHQAVVHPGQNEDRADHQYPRSQSEASMFSPANSALANDFEVRAEVITLNHRRANCWPVIKQSGALIMGIG